MMKKYLLVGLMILLGGFTFGQTWEEKTPYPGPPRHHPATFVIDEKAYLLTGSTATEFTKDFYKYDPTDDSWEELPEFPGTARSFSYAVANNGKGYIGFGVSDADFLNDLWEYDPSTETWTQLTSCPCTKRAHPAFVVQDDRIFVGMGNFTSNLNDWWEYNIDTDSWRPLPNLPGPERHHPYHFAVDGSVYVGLGHGAGMAIYKDWYRWDLDTESWEIMNDFPDQARVAGTQFNIGNRGFVLSGDGDDHSTMATGEFWEYDYQTDTWEQKPPHPGVSRWAPGSFTIGNVAYFTSGQVREGNPGEGLQNDLWSFEVESLANTDKERLEAITIYPNPTEEALHIKGVEMDEISSIQLYNGVGKFIREEIISGSQIDVAHLNSGLYFISFTTQSGEVKRLKFIKK